jgi:mxaA protein
LNRTAGQAVFEPGIDGFVTAQPRFRPLRDDLITFFRHSRREFFEPDARASADRAWLIEFGRRCRDVERGSA